MINNPWRMHCLFNDEASNEYAAKTIIDEIKFEEREYVPPIESHKHAEGHISGPADIGNQFGGQVD